MIELNLLPDVKLEYIQAQRSRSLVLTGAVFVSIAAIALLLLLLAVSGLQKKHISDLTKDIKKDNATLQSKPDVDKILTVQNQLESLTGLHAGEPAAANFFSYLNDTTPSQVSITDFTTDFTQHTATINGSANALSSVNQYIDTLKYTKYTTSDNKNAQPAFSNIVLSSFSINSGGTASSQAANYSIALSYDPTIFDITKSTKLAVPSITTTRAQLNQPTDLFTPSQSSTGGGQ